MTYFLTHVMTWPEVTHLLLWLDWTKVMNHLDIILIAKIWVHNYKLYVSKQPVIWELTCSIVDYVFKQHSSMSHPSKPKILGSHTYQLYKKLSNTEH